MILTDMPIKASLFHVLSRTRRTLKWLFSYFGIFTLAFGLGGLGFFSKRILGLWVGMCLNILFRCMNGLEQIGHFW